MPEQRPIARIRLARSLPRLLRAPIVLALLGAGVVAAALLLLAPPLAYAAAGAGALVSVIGIGWGIVLLTIRLDVEEATVRLHRLGRDRRYLLTPGPVTRVRLRGEQASALRSRAGLLGYQLGAAVLRDEEEIEVIRLAPTATAILVPTERGRLAIAASSEEELLDALAEAARARQRSEELAGAAAAEAAQEAGPPEPEPHVLTGIERAMLEERLARERAEADAARTDDDAETAKTEAEGLPPEAGVTIEPAREMAGPAGELSEPERRAPRRRFGLPRRRRTVELPLGRPRASAAIVVLPLIGSGAVWLAAMLLDRLPAPESDLGRLTALALVLAGPATTVAAILARAWWPRLVGVVVTGGLAAAVFVGRALYGG